MNIGIDIDGVLTDIQGFNRRHAPPFFKRKFGRDVADENPYDIRDIFGCPENEYLAYWNKYLLKYVTLEPARKGAKAIIRKLRADGHTIYVITKRVHVCKDNFLGKLMRFLVRDWLRRNGICYKEIVFCDNDVPDSKRTACLDKHIDVMVDDEIANIEAIAPIAKVICYDASYNRECESKNIIRAREWDEIAILLNEWNDN